MKPELAIIRTVQYSDIFDHPLKLEELRTYLPILMTDENLRHTLEKTTIANEIESNNSYFFLRGKKHILEIRSEREKVSNKIWKIVQDIVPLFEYVPFVEMVCVTGSFAVKYGEPGADIDFLVLTSPKRVWLVRLMIFFLELYLEKIRYPHIDFCFNYILSTEEEKINKTAFTAREILQMRPIYKSKGYERFVLKHDWLIQFYPNVVLSNHMEEAQSTIPGISKSRIVRFLDRFDVGFVKVVLDKLNRIEMRRAVIAIKKIYGNRKETYFSENSYKGHFAGNNEKVMNKFSRYYSDRD